MGKNGSSRLWGKLLKTLWVTDDHVDMNLVVGLGNPGAKYIKTRHNIGFQFIAFVTGSRPGFIFKSAGSLMNSSGKAVHKLLKQYGVEPDNLYVVHDDLDIPIGKFKIQKARGPKDHNGIKSVDKELGTKDYWRVRIGVENRNPKKWVSGEEYTLQDFTEEENKIIKKVFSEVLDNLIHE